jgi:predicted nucleotidyltransferase
LERTLLYKRAANKLQLEEEDYKALHIILKKYPYKFYVYGSRSRGSSSKYSDIGIFCKENIEQDDLVDIRTQLEESDIIIKVDITDKNSCNQEFIKNIEKDLIELK